MICPNCHAEYRDGFTTCADCEVPLVHDLAEAAAEAEGEASELAALGLGGASPGADGELAPLVELASPETLGLFLEQLEERQIPYVVQAGTALCLAYGRDLESPGVPDPWRARVLVASPFRREAKLLVDGLLAEARRQAAGGLG